jgi:putative ABC transport system permease protein
MRLWRFLRRKHWDRERELEIQAHLQIETDDFIARGMSPEQARHAARRKLGNLTQIREEIQEMNSLGFLETLGQDLRYAIRMLRLNPGFTLVAVLSLALGIGANTAIFQLLDAVRLRSLPVAKPAELCEVKVVSPKGRSGNFPNRYGHITNAMWEQIRDRQEAFSSIFAWGDWPFDLSQGGRVRQTEGIWVSGDYFRTLGVSPLMGRLISSEDDRRGCAPVAVISYAFWQREFGGAASAVGSTVSLDTHPVQVIGVTPANFTGIDVGHRFDLAVPVCSEPVFSGKDNKLERRWAWWLTSVGRLKPGWTPKRADAHLQALASSVFAAALPEQFDAERQKNFLSYSLKTSPAAQGLSDLRETYEDPLWLLIGIAGVVLLIACANLANLLLARATAREKEVAVRLAIGGSRGRLVRQFLTESLLLSLVGAVCGVLLARFLSQALVAFLTTSQQTIFLDLHMNVLVLVFAAGLAIFTCLLFGLIPALRATRIVPAAVMKAGGRGTTAGRERFTLQRALVAGQVALSLVLLFAALLFVRTFHKLSTLNAGFRTDGILVVSLDGQRAGYTKEQWPVVDRQLLERVRSAPGVDRAARAEAFPMSGGWFNDHVTPADGDAAKAEGKLSFFTMASPGFFEVMGIPLLAGRDLADSDTATAPLVAVVNQAFARKIFGTANVLGRRFTKRDGVRRQSQTFEIVGVAGDTKVTSLREDNELMAYVPDTQLPGAELSQTIVVHANVPLRDVMTAVLRGVAEVNPAISVDFNVFKTQIEETLVPESLMATLSGFFGLLAGILAVIGLYGVISYMVAQRRNEIGIRMALGAGRSSILKMVLRRAGTLIAAGLAVGTVLALLGARAASSLLFGLRPYDPATLILAVLLLAAVSFLAAAVPARRAARLEPMNALRDE